MTVVHSDVYKKPLKKTSLDLCSILSFQSFPVWIILQFYSAVFFDNGCTFHQHLDVEFYNVQLLLQWRNGCLIP